VETLLAVALGIVVVFWAMVGWLTWRGVRAIRRSRMVTTWRVQAGRRPDFFERRVLTVTARAHPGRTGEIATLRLRLQDSVESTHRALAAAEHADQPVGYLPSIGADLARVSAPLAAQLALAQREPDPTIQRSQLDALRPQVDQVCDAAADIRRALADAANSMTTRQLDQVSADLDSEVKAMASWSATYRRIGPAT
jgi:hypothetical protein